MRVFSRFLTIFSLAVGLAAVDFARADADVLPPVSDRFADAGTDEAPNFQKHIVPLFGRLGCNGRACHGSFQGQGGFRLSLFGYDFQADYDALLEEGNPRVDVKNADESLIIAKPTDADFHEGGKRYELAGWEHHLIRRWIASGAQFKQAALQKLTRLEVHPPEVYFQPGQPGRTQLQVIAVWEDGVREDVTQLCRFKSNDDTVADVDANGLVTGDSPGDTHVIVAYDKAVVPVPAIRATTDLAGDRYPDVPTPTRVDELVVEKLRKLGIVPSELASDAEFLRRVRLDMTGTLPTSEEVREFLASDDPAKRAKKIDELLETPAYAAWWTTKLCDFTGNNEQLLNNVSPMRSASQEWYDWIYRRVADNTPYDELAAGIITANSMKPDQSYREYCEQMSALYGDSDASYADLDSMTHYWSRSDFRDIEARAIGFAYSFLGMQIQCAQCHKHPFDTWSKNDFHQFKNFFARVVAGRANGVPREYRKEYDQMVNSLGLKGKRGNDLRRALPDLLRDGKTIPFPVTYVSSNLQRTRNPDEDYPSFDNGRLLGGDEVDVLAVDDPRAVLMDWLRSPDNPFFAKALVNRVWAAYFGIGIVEPPDDLSLGNPPSNRALLDDLAARFVESGFDMKWLHRTIANSRTYQLSWQANDTNGQDERNFSRSIPRRLPAEVAYDALQQATVDTAAVAAMHASNDGRAIALPGAGRRNSNGDQGFALAVFGRSTRESNCDCDRSSEPTLLQTVFLQNDNSLLRMLEGNRGSWLAEISREIRSEPARGADATPAGRRGAALNQQIEGLQSRLKRLRQSGNKRAIEVAEQRLAELEKQRRALGRRGEGVASREPDAAAIDAEVVDRLITDAYLRTLSRFPNQDELARTRQYVAEADDPMDGVRDVLWSLVNTKEFIVNH